MVYHCSVQNNIGVHTYLRGECEEVYDWVDTFFFKNEGKEPMIIDHVDREDDEVFVHLMSNHREVYCEQCNIMLNSEKQYYHHVKGNKHQCLMS
jgi:hypothetical protein